MTGSEAILFTVALIVITNPLAAIPIFLSLTSGFTSGAKIKTALTSGIAVVIILLITNWVGTELLGFFGITIAAFELAGGLIILLMGLHMLQAKDTGVSNSKDETLHHAAKSSPVAVVPLALPLMAGPGAISTVILHTHRHHSLFDKFFASGIEIGIAILLTVCLLASNFIGRLLGPAGLKIMVRIMGLVLAAIAMQILISGFTTAFPVLHG
jgi:multiple antibiotic resistance protein